MSGTVVIPPGFESMNALSGSSGLLETAGVTGTYTGAGAGAGVLGVSEDGRGVVGNSTNQAGVIGESTKFDGVFGVSHNPSAAGVSGHNPGGLAGFFEGNIVVTGTLTAMVDIFLANGDCAEEFDVDDSEIAVEAGTVMVLGDDGAVRPCSGPYDTRVIGVVSGAGSFRPALILDKKATGRKRLPLGLIGKVFCKVESDHSPIRAGDLLTTSVVPGHAMRASDVIRAFGATIGKALASFEGGRGMIPVLVCLR